MLKIGSLSGPTWEEVASRFRDVLPANPLSPRSLPAPAWLEGPPRLDARERHRWPLRLLRSYRSVAAAWFGECRHDDPRFCDKRYCFVEGAERLDQSDVTGPVWAHLVRAADQIYERKWAPIAWAAFSCQTWARFGKRRMRPHVVWVYSKVRIERGGALESRPQDAGFFDWASSARFAHNRVVLEELHREVCRRWARAQGALRSAYAADPKLSDEAALAVVRADFDPLWYAGACERIDALARKREDAWWVRRQKDEWLWDR